MNAHQEEKRNDGIIIKLLKTYNLLCLHKILLNIYKNPGFSVPYCTG